MGWFRVHSDDLHQVVQDAKEEQVEVRPETRVKTRDVSVYIGSYRNEYSPFPAPYVHFCHGDVMTKTSARDAFVKAVDLLMAEKGFDPQQSYAISVQHKIIQELVE